MGYASQKFATPQKFEKWLNENEHENKAELDKICSGKTDDWDSKFCHAHLSGDKLCLCKKKADGTMETVCELGVCTPTGEVITGIKNSITESKGISGTIIVNTTDWTDYAYTTTIAKLGEKDAIFFTPSTRSDKEATENAEVFIEANGGEVTFSCTSVPNAGITFKYFIVKGAV